MIEEQRNDAKWTLESLLEEASIVSSNLGFMFDLTYRYYKNEWVANLGMWNYKAETAFDALEGLKMYVCSKRKWDTSKEKKR